MRCSSAVALLALVSGQLAAQEPPALDARLSPDGRTVVARVVDGASVRLLRVTPYDPLEEPRWLTLPGMDVESVSWTPDGNRVVYTPVDGHAYVQAAVADVAASAPLDLTPGVEGPTRLVGFVGDTAALLELPGEWPDRPDLYRASLAGGSPELVLRNDGGVTKWFAQDGVPRLALREGEGGDSEIGRIRDGMIVPMYPCGDATVCEPVGFSADGRVWVRTSRDRAAPALVLADPLTLNTELARTDLGVDTGAVIREDSVYARDVGRLRALLGEAEAAFHEAPAAGGGRMLVTARDADGEMLYVFDRWAGSLERVLPMADQTEALSVTGAVVPVPDATLPWPDRLRYSVSAGEPGMPPTDVRRSIERSTENGRAVLVVVDEAEVPTFPAFALDTLLIQDPAFEPDLSFPMDEMAMAEATDSTVLDATTLQPIRRHASGPFALDLGFGPGGISGSLTMDGFETGISVSGAGPVWSDGAALEILVAALPLTTGYETEVDYFDSGLQEVIRAQVSVGAAARVTTEAGDFDGWTVTISPRAEAAGEQTWMVRRSAPHVLLRATIESTDSDRIVELVDAEDLR